jgi:hypothetical protein
MTDCCVQAHCAIQPPYRHPHCRTLSLSSATVSFLSSLRSIFPHVSSHCSVCVLLSLHLSSLCSVCVLLSLRLSSHCCVCVLLSLRLSSLCSVCVLLSLRLSSLCSVCFLLSLRLTSLSRLFIVLSNLHFDDVSGGASTQSAVSYSQL